MIENTIEFQSYFMHVVSREERMRMKMRMRKSVSVFVFAMILGVSMICAPLLAFPAYASSKPARPVITALSNSASSITIKWKKVKKAKGYEIYRSNNDNGHYKKIKTIKKGSTTSWTNRNLTKDQWYYYKVKSYKKSHSKTVRSSFSDWDGSMPTNIPFYYTCFSLEYDADEQSYIDVDFCNWSTSNMVVYGKGLFVMDINNYDSNDDNTYNDCTVYPNPITIRPDQEKILSYDQGDYVVSFSDVDSYLVDVLTFRGVTYTFDVNNYYSYDPEPFGTSSYSKAVKSFVKMANHKSDPKAVEKYEHMQEVNK